MPGNLSGRTDRRTDGHAVKRSRLVGWTNRPMYRSKEGISGFGRTDRRTDGQPENIMPKGRGIKRCGCRQTAIWLQKRWSTIDNAISLDRYVCMCIKHLRKINIQLVYFSTPTTWMVRVDMDGNFFLWDIVISIDTLASPDIYRESLFTFNVFRHQRMDMTLNLEVLCVCYLFVS